VGYLAVRKKGQAMADTTTSAPAASAPATDHGASDERPHATLEQNYNDSRAAFRHWETAQNRTDQQLYQVIGRLAEFAAAAGNDHEALAAFAAAKNVRATKASPPYTIVTKLVVTTDRKKASKYAMVLQLAARRGIEPTVASVAAFIKDEGGIEACLRQFRELPKQGSASKREGRPSAFNKAVQRIAGFDRIKAPADLQLASLSEDYFLIVGMRDADGTLNLLREPVMDGGLVRKAVAAIALKE
jgi:hypothetical protein